MRSKFDNKEELQKAALEAKSLIDVLRYFGMTVRGNGNYRSAKKFLVRYNIDTSHFDPYHKRVKVLQTNALRTQISLEEILKGKHPTYMGSKLYKRLIKANLKLPKCEICGQKDEWRGQPLTLHIDHIDGNHTNHKLENLRVLCPHCHSQTDTFGSKNK